MVPVLSSPNGKRPSAGVRSASGNCSGRGNRGRKRNLLLREKIRNCRPGTTATNSASWPRTPQFTCGPLDSAYLLALNWTVTCTVGSASFPFQTPIRVASSFLLHLIEAWHSFPPSLFLLHPEE